MRRAPIVQAALATLMMATVTGAVAQTSDVKTSEEQAKAYVLSEIAPQDRDAYTQYLRNVLPIIEKHGGRVVITPFQPKAVIEGRPVEGNLALIEFPNAAARDAFWGSPEYQPWKKQRQANGTSRVIHVE